MTNFLFRCLILPYALDQKIIFIKFFVKIQLQLFLRLIILANTCWCLIIATIY